MSSVLTKEHILMPDGSELRRAIGSLRESILGRVLERVLSTYFRASSLEVWVGAIECNWEGT